jgi:hypothetical protein
MMERHIAYFGRLVETTERNTELMGQLIRAIAQITPLVVNVSDNLNQGFRDTVGAVRELPSALKDLLKVPEATPNSTLGPAAAQPVEPAQDLAPSPAPELEEPAQLKRKSAEVSVYSCPNRGTGRFYTSVSMDRSLWEHAGFVEGDRYILDYDNRKITIARATEGGGVKAKKIGKQVVVFQTTMLGDLNFKRKFVQVADGIVQI